MYQLGIDVIAEKALLHFGHASQEKKALEELGELISALAKVYYGGSASAVVDEIADTMIMLRQLRIMYGHELVDERIEFKIHRLSERMGEE